MEVERGLIEGTGFPVGTGDCMRTQDLPGVASFFVEKEIFRNVARGKFMGVD